MSFLKSAFVALALVFGSLTTVAVTATPAEAALTPTQQAVEDLALQRIAQIDAQIAPFQAIIDDPNSTATERNEARAAIQIAQLRRLQFQQFVSFVTFFPETVLLSFEASFTRLVSENISLVPTV